MCFDNFDSFFTMSSSSLLYLAVQKSLSSGSSLIKGGSSFSSFYSISKTETAIVEMTDMPDYIDVLVDEVKLYSPKCFAKFRKEIIESLLDCKDFEAYAWGENSHISSNSLYENSLGKFNLFLYCMNPVNNDQDCKVEVMRISFNFRLPDICVTLTHTKKNLFSKRKTYTEKKYLPAAVKSVDFVNALAIAIYPLIQTSVDIGPPVGLREELINNAKNCPTSVPSDDERRMVYDPVKQMSVVATDPEVLKLIPTRWITVTNEIPSVASNSVWEFD